MTTTSPSWRSGAGAKAPPTHVVRWLLLAAAVEAGTGVVLMVSPTLFVRLLLGAELTEPGQAVGRLAGFALLALGLACWPAAQAPSRTAAALRAILIYSLLATIYLLYLGTTGDPVGGVVMAGGRLPCGLDASARSRVAQQPTARKDCVR
jgi:hypothetical protein